MRFLVLLCLVFFVSGCHGRRPLPPLTDKEAAVTIEFASPERMQQLTEKCLEVGDAPSVRGGVGTATSYYGNVTTTTTTGAITSERAIRKVAAQFNADTAQIIYADSSRTYLRLWNCRQKD